MVHDTDDDLPWDPLWAYVLGEEDGGNDGFWRKNKKPQNEGLMSYITDVLPESDSRDDRASSVRADVKTTRSKDSTKSNGFAWRRQNRNVESDADDGVWEWHISTGNSDEEVAAAPSLSRSISPSNERRRGVFRRNNRTIEAQSSESSAREPATTKGRALDAKSSDSWEWRLNSGSENNEKSVSSFPPVNENSQSKQRRTPMFASAFRKKEEPDVWGSTQKKEKRNIFSNKKEPDPWDFMTVTSQDKGPRKVRFNRSSSSKDEQPWIDPNEVMIQLEKSQTSLFDWVGINPSYEEDESNQKATNRRSTGVSNEKVQKDDMESVSDSGDLFSGIFNWNGSMDDEDESSYQSSTEYSSAGTLEDDTDGYSDEDSRSQSTIKDTSQSVNTEFTEKSLSNSVGTSVNEVRLSFQPVIPANGEERSRPLPIIEEEEDASRTDSPFSETEATVPNTESIQALSTPGNLGDQVKSTDDTNKFKKDSGRDLINFPLARGRNTCCSVKNLSTEQLQWSKENGIPFHELSPEEKSKLFPKTKAVSDIDNNSSSKNAVTTQVDRNTAHAESQPLSSSVGPQSLLEYEYKTGINMYLLYDRFGTDPMRIIRTPTPKNDAMMSHDQIVIIVEASTVSPTDCAIRQGYWWQATMPPLPNTPGVDAVGRIFRINEETSQKYGLEIGDRIMSLVKWGGNARYMSVKASNAVIVPDAADPVLAVCLTEVYLAAFQALHLGQTNQLRYRDDSLRGKSILLRGFSISSMGHAIAQLAAIGGAASVFAVAKIKHFNYLRSLGITPLDNNGKEWWKRLKGKVDLIISCDEDAIAIPYKLLKGNGCAITLKNFGKINSPKRSEEDIKLSPSKNMLNMYNRKERIARNRNTDYDVYEQWETNLDCCKDDLQHLLQLLELKKISPTILDRISLNKVADAQELVASKRLSGFVVCEPWLVGKSRTICL